MNHPLDPFHVDKVGHLSLVKLAKTWNKNYTGYTEKRDVHGPWPFITGSLTSVWRNGESVSGGSVSSQRNVKPTTVHRVREESVVTKGKLKCVTDVIHSHHRSKILYLLRFFTDRWVQGRNYKEKTS